MEIDHTNDFLAQHLGNLLSRQPIVEPKVGRGHGSEACSDTASNRATASVQGSEADDELTRLVISATRNQIERDEAAAERESINQGRRLAAQRFDDLQRRSGKSKSDAPKSHRRTASAWASTGEGRRGSRGSLTVQSDMGPSRRSRGDRSSDPPIATDLTSETDRSDTSPKVSRREAHEVAFAELDAGRVRSRDFALENVEQGIEGPGEPGRKASPSGSPCVQWPDPFETLTKRDAASTSYSRPENGTATSGPRFTSMQTKLPPPSSLASRMRLFGDRSSAGPHSAGADIVAPPRAFSSDGRSSGRASNNSNAAGSASGLEDPAEPARGEDAIAAQARTGAAASSSSQRLHPPPVAKRLTLVPVGEDGRSFRFVETPEEPQPPASTASDRNSMAANCTVERTPSPTAEEAWPSNSIDDKDNLMSRSTSLGSLPSDKRHALAATSSAPERSRSATTRFSNGSSDSKSSSFTFGSRAGGFSVSYGSFRASDRRARATRSEAAPRRSPSRSEIEGQEGESQDLDEAGERRRQSEPGLASSSSGSSSRAESASPPADGQGRRRGSPSGTSDQASDDSARLRPPLSQSRFGMHSYGGRSASGSGSGFGSSLAGTSNSSPTNGSQSALANSEANDSEETELTSSSEGASPDGSEGRGAGPILERPSALEKKKLLPLTEHREAEALELADADEAPPDHRAAEEVVA